MGGYAELHQEAPHLLASLIFFHHRLQSVSVPVNMKRSPHDIFMYAQREGQV